MPVKRFTFSLERLLTIKRQLEKMADAELQRASHRVEEIRRELQRLYSRLADLSQHVTEKAVTVNLAAQWQAHAVLIDRLSCEIIQTEQRLQSAQDEYQRAWRRRTAIAAEVESLQTLRQHYWQHWRQLAHKARQIELDERCLQRWNGQRLDQHTP